MFVLASNHFQKCFSVNVGVWLRMKNKFSRNAFQLIVCFSWFDPEMVWSENFHFKLFPNSCAKRERDRTQIMPQTQSPEPFDFAPFDFDFESHPDCTLRLRRRTQSPELRVLGLWLRIAPRSHPSTLPANPELRSRLRLRRDRTETAPTALRSQLRNGWVLMNLTGFNDFFLLDFVSVFIYWEMVLYICLKAEKMWENVRNKKKMCFLYYFQQYNKP